jgi:hypothetical protein
MDVNPLSLQWHARKTAEDGNAEFAGWSRASRSCSNKRRLTITGRSPSFLELLIIRHLRAGGYIPADDGPKGRKAR